VDTDAWSEGPDGCQQTLLHRAIDENAEEEACFLVRSGCDVNSARREGPGGSGGEEAHDLASPLHLCCQWGLETTARTLLEHGAEVNAKVRLILVLIEKELIALHIVRTIKVSVKKPFLLH